MTLIAELDWLNLALAIWAALTFCLDWPELAMLALVPVAVGIFRFTAWLGVPVQIAIIESRLAATWILFVATIIVLPRIIECIPANRKE